MLRPGNTRRCDDKRIHISCQIDEVSHKTIAHPLYRSQIGVTDGHCKCLRPPCDCSTDPTETKYAKPLFSYPARNWKPGRRPSSRTNKATAFAKPAERRKQRGHRYKSATSSVRTSGVVVTLT